MKYFLVLSILVMSSFANANFQNMKNCETIKLSLFTVLVSCHNLDYIIEYKKVEEPEEQDTVKRITVVTPNDQRVIKNMGDK